MRLRFVVIGAVVVLAGLAGSIAFTMLRKPPAAPAPVPVVAAPVEKPAITHTVIGHSVEGRDIETYSYGTGPMHLLFVGGIHGGYEWNSVVLAYQLMDYLAANPWVVPSGETVTIIPNANPDAVYEAIGKEGRFGAEDVPSGDLSPERFNAHAVDLNRNFDCNWKPTGTWQNKTVSAGTAPFSEPEAVALRDYLLSDRPAAAVFWHSQANGVYASQCGKGILPGTLDLMNMYAKASGYPAIKEFTAYPTTGAAEDWLASIGIPAITVELSTHSSVEWDKNLKGIIAVISSLRTQ